MWSRKSLKEKAKKVVKNNYWSFIIVCFILAIVTGEFNIFSVNIGTDKESINPNDNSSYYFIINEIEKYKDKSVDYLNDQLVSIKDFGNTIKTNDNKMIDKIISQVELNLNNLLKSQKYVLKIIDASRLLAYDLTIEGTILLLAAGIAFLFLIFVAEPLKVGGKRFFIKSRKRKNQKISLLVSVFAKDQWTNITKITLLKNVFLFFWMFTIVGWFIKRYEYEMIPYILADNPHIKEKEAFKLSKQMMYGNKWKTFVLDISFILWNILSILTLGLVAILYVNEYKYATKAELYAELKKENQNKN